MDAYTALALNQIRAAELQADARRDALVKSVTGRRMHRVFHRRTATTRTAAAACATCPA